MPPDWDGPFHSPLSTSIPVCHRASRAAQQRRPEFGSLEQENEDWWSSQCALAWGPESTIPPCRDPSRETDHDLRYLPVERREYRSSATFWNILTHNNCSFSVRMNRSTQPLHSGWRTNDGKTPCPERRFTLDSRCSCTGCRGLSGYGCPQPCRRGNHTRRGDSKDRGRSVFAKKLFGWN
jgi:hypothetical protein